MKKIKACIIGATGYTGSELLRLLIHHPSVETICAVSSNSHGQKVTAVFPELIGDTEQFFASEPDADSDIYFLCLPHGESAAYLHRNPAILSKKVIDLSRDFRSTTNAYKTMQFVYGLPELNSHKIKSADAVANPGCFATAIQLGLLPLLKNKQIKSSIYTNAITGSTGAGAKLSNSTHFSWRQNNHSVYKAFEHEHNEEIMKTITSLQNNFTRDFVFIPQRGAFTRGIFTTTIIESDEYLSKLYDLYHSYYAEHPFTHVVKENIDLKMAVNSNKCFIHLQKKGNQLLIETCIDNLLKGASGQAVQNMNLMFGLDETSGLKLKAAKF